MQAGRARWFGSPGDVRSGGESKAPRVPINMSEKIRSEAPLCGKGPDVTPISDRVGPQPDTQGCSRFSHCLTVSYKSEEGIDDRHSQDRHVARGGVFRTRA